MNIALAAKQTDGALDLEYAGSNATGAPILVFDRLYAMASGRMEPSWAYVTVIGGHATVSRALCELPPGLHHENPEVPYGRQVEAGEAIKGRVRLALPLHDASPYQHILRPAPPQPTTVTELDFRLGWCPAPSAQTMPSGIQPITWDGERLWLLPYAMVLRVQQVVTTGLPLPGLAGQTSAR